MATKYYSSLFKQPDVKITQKFKGIGTHGGIDVSRGIIRQPLYLPNKVKTATVYKKYTSYTAYGTKYTNALILWLKHDDGTGSRYIHGYPEDCKLNVGDTIKAGDYVCKTGNTGHSSGDHLHYEWLTDYRNLDTRIDPEPYIINDNAEDCEEVKRANEIMRKTIEELNLEASSLKEQLKSEGKDLIDALEKNKKLNYELEDLKITVEKKTQQIDLLNKQLDDVDNQKQSILVELGKCSALVDKLENEALQPQDKHYRTLYEDLKKKYDMLSEKVDPMSVGELIKELFRRVLRKS